MELTKLFKLITFIKKNLPFLTALTVPLLSLAAYKLFPYAQPLWLPLQRTNRHGGHLVAKVLKAHGVQFVFTLIGGHISPIVVAAKQEGIRVIDVRNECTTVFAADAVSRLSGVPGVAVVTAGPGVTNTVTAMKNAQMAQSPVVVIGGAAATLLKGRGSLQDVEQLAVLRSIAKYSASVSSVREIVPILRRAFYESQSGVPGPVFVEIPIDCLYCIGELLAVAGLGQCARKRALSAEQRRRVVVPHESNIRGRRPFDAAAIEKYLATQTAEQPIYIDAAPRRMPFAIEHYLRYQIRYLFAGAFSKEYEARPIAIETARPSPRSVERIVSLLMAAQRPCLLVSSQALSLNVERAEAIKAAVETVAVPTFLSSMARGLLGREHPLFIKQGRTAALKEADLIILCGIAVDFRLDYGRQLNRAATIIAINRCHSELRLNSDLFWTPTVKMQCDAGLTLLAMAERIATRFQRQHKAQSAGPWERWRSTLKEREALRERQNAAKALTPSFPRPALGMKDKKEALNPLAVCQQIERWMDDEAVLIVDGGDFAASAAYVCRPRGALKWMDPGPFGTLGVGMGFAMAAKLTSPRAEVWLVWGDGSSGYSIAEVDTLRRFGLGVICVIGNDACWSQIEREQIPKLGDNTGCMLSYCDYDVVCKGFGGGGETVHEKKAMLKEEDNPFVRAKKYVKEFNAPYVINAHIGISDFREGSISV